MKLPIGKPAFGVWRLPFGTPAERIYVVEAYHFLSFGHTEEEKRVLSYDCATERRMPNGERLTSNG
jgi:hypothetical protein